MRTFDCAGCFEPFPQDELETCGECFWDSDYCAACLNAHVHNDYECQCFDDWESETPWEDA